MRAVSVWKKKQSQTVVEAFLLSLSREKNQTMNIFSVQGFENILFSFVYTGSKSLNDLDSNDGSFHHIIALINGLDSKNSY